MAGLHRLSFGFLAVLLLLQLAVSTDSPSPAPQIPADSPPPISPSPSPGFSSPPAPPPPDLAPGSSPTPSPADSPPSPSPAPDAAGGIGHVTGDVNTGGDVKEESSGGLNGGKKAGIAIGVVACLSFVGIGALVYKKRQQNIQRSQLGYAARREIL